MSDHGNGAAVEMRKAGVGMFADVEPAQLPAGKKTFLGVGGGFDAFTAFAFQQCQREESGETGPIPAMVVVIHCKNDDWVVQQWKNAEKVGNCIYRLDEDCYYNGPDDFIMTRKNGQGREMPRTPTHAIIAWLLTGKVVRNLDDWSSPREKQVDNIYLAIVPPGSERADEREQIMSDLFSLKAFKGTIPVMVDTGGDVTDITDDQDRPLAVAAKKALPNTMVVVVAPGADDQQSGKYPEFSVENSKTWQLLDAKATLLEPSSGFFDILQMCMTPWPDSKDRTPGILLTAHKLAADNPERTFPIWRFHAKEGVPSTVLTAGFVDTMWVVDMPPNSDTNN